MTEPTPHYTGGCLCGALPRLLEIDLQLVTHDLGNHVVAEFLVEDAQP